MAELTYAERSAMRPSVSGDFAESPLGVLLERGPEELIVDHPDAECPEVRQAGTLGEVHGPNNLVNLVRVQAQRSLYYFNLVFMGGHSLMSPHVQGMYCDLLQRVPPYRKLLLAPRGTLKTTITKGLLLHVFIQPLGENIYFPHGRIGYLQHNEGKSTRVLLGSKGAELSERKLIELRTYIENTPLLRAFWPDVFWQEPRRQATAWNNQRLFLPRREIFKEASIETTGVGGTITGDHFNIGVYDDLVAEEDRFSVANQERAYNWVHAVHFLLDDREHAHEIFLGTHWSNNDVYVRMKREDSELVAWTFSAVKDDGSAFWPEVYPISNLKAIEKTLIDAGKGDLYALNYLNDPHHSSIVSFDASKLRYFRWNADMTEIEIDDDPRDHALHQDFSTGSAQTGVQFTKGQRLTPDFYKQHRSELKEGLKALWLKERYRDQT